MAGVLLDACVCVSYVCRYEGGKVTLDIAIRGQPRGSGSNNLSYTVMCMMPVP